MKYSRIAEERKKMGLSQEELASRLKISQKSISKYECGTRRPSYETLVSMSAIFGVSIDYLLGNSNDVNCATKSESTNKEEGYFFFFFDNLLKDVFTSRLKRAMSDKKITDDEFSDVVSFDKDKYESYINGDCEPSLEDLITISKALEVSIDYLLGQIDSQEEKVLHSFRQLNEDNKDIIIGEIKKCLKEQRYESVAADEPLKKTGTENSGK